MQGSRWAQRVGDVATTPAPSSVVAAAAEQETSLLTTAGPAPALEREVALTIDATTPTAAPAVNDSSPSPSHVSRLVSFGRSLVAGSATAAAVTVAASTSAVVTPLAPPTDDSDNQGVSLGALQFTLGGDALRGRSRVAAIKRERRVRRRTSTELTGAAAGVFGHLAERLDTSLPRHYNFGRNAERPADPHAFQRVTAPFTSNTAPATTSGGRAVPSVDALRNSGDSVVANEVTARAAWSAAVATEVIEAAGSRRTASGGNAPLITRAPMTETTSTAAPALALSIRLPPSVAELSGVAPSAFTFGGPAPFAAPVPWIFAPQHSSGVSAAAAATAGGDAAAAAATAVTMPVTSSGSVEVSVELEGAAQVPARRGLGVVAAAQGGMIVPADRQLSGSDDGRVYRLVAGRWRLGAVTTRTETTPFNMTATAAEDWTAARTASRQAARAAAETERAARMAEMQRMVEELVLSHARIPATTLVAFATVEEPVATRALTAATAVVEAAAAAAAAGAARVEAAGPALSAPTSSGGTPQGFHSTTTGSNGNTAVPTVPMPDRSSSGVRRTKWRAKVAEAQAESATARVQELEGHPEALQGFSLEALRVLVRDIGHGQDRARHALEHAESVSRASVEAAGARRE